MGKLTPITELPDTLERWGDIAWHLDPGVYVDAERIGLDVSRMQRLMGCAGLKAATVRGYQGEQSQIQVNVSSITGINPDASASGAGSASVVRAPTQKTSLEHEDESFAFRWPIANININRPEIASRVADHKRNNPNVSRETAWAHHVDKALRSGIVGAAVKGLVQDPWREDKTGILFFDGIVGLDIYQGNYTGAGFFWALLQGGPLVSQFISDKLYGQKRNWPPLKPSLVPRGFQPDRLAVTALLAKTQSLVRPIV